MNGKLKPRMMRGFAIVAQANQIKQMKIHTFKVIKRKNTSRRSKFELRTRKKQMAISHREKCEKERARELISELR